MRSTPVMTFSPCGPYFRKMRISCRGDDRLGRLGRFLVDELEALDVALVFENAGDLDLELRGGHIDSGMLRNDGIPKAREHIGNRVCHVSSLSRSQLALSRLARGLLTSGSLYSALPAALRHARDVALQRQLAEAEAAQRELAQVRARAGRTDGSGSAGGP